MEELLRSGIAFRRAACSADVQHNRQVGRALEYSKEDAMNTKQLLNNLLKDESGQDLIEYALLAAIIALGSVAAMGVLATKISTAFSAIGTKLTNATT